MKEEIILFLKKATEDEEIQKRMMACKSPEEAYAVASSVQEGFTFEEFTETMTKINELSSKELSDEDLAAAAGGAVSTDEVISYAIGGVWVGSTISAMAALGACY